MFTKTYTTVLLNKYTRTKNNEKKLNTILADRKLPDNVT